MIIGDVEFAKLISDAEILGLGYINIPISQSDSTPLEIALFFKDEVKGKMVTKRFLEWIKLSNNNMNAFAFDIIEKNDNSYLLCFYQDEKLLIERNVSKEIVEWVEPIVAKLTYFKSINKRSDMYYKFKEACKFSKCHIYGADKKGRIFNFNDVIIKENIKFYKEDDITEESPLYAFKLKNESERYGKNIKDKKINIKDNSTIRMNNIKKFLPIIYNEIVNCKYFNNILDALRENFEKDIIIQAICNIVLEYRLSEENVDVDRNSEIDIIQYLANNYESPRSKFPKDNEYTKEMILEQIKRDEEYYNKVLGGK